MAGRPPRESADGKERLLKACWDLLLDLEPGQRLTIASVCAEAGCTPPTLYHHFGSLAELERAASQEALEEWNDHLMARYAESDSNLEGRLLVVVSAYLEWAQSNPRAYYVLFNRPGANYFPASLDDLSEIVLMPVILNDLAELCGLPPHSQRVRDLALGHWAGLHGVASMAIANTNFTPEIQKRTFDVIASAMTDPFIRPEGTLAYDDDASNASVSGGGSLSSSD